MNRLVVFLAAQLFLCTISFAQTGAISTVAGGSFAASFAGDGLLANDPSVRLAWPTGICRDAAGNIYFSDNGNARVRKVNAVTGILTTVAGMGPGAPLGDGGPATAAGLNFVVAAAGALAVDNLNNLYISEGYRIRKVNSSTGIITTVAGNGSTSYSGDGGPATSAGIMTRFIYADAAGNLYFPQDNRIRRISAATGIVSVFAGSATPGYSGDGGPATAAATRCSGSGAITGDAAGNIYFYDYGNEVMRKVNSSGGISTICGMVGVSGYSGDGGPATAAAITDIKGVGLDGSGNIYLSQNLAVIRKINAATGIIQTVAGCITGCTLDDQYAPDYTPVVLTAIEPRDICVGPSGIVYYTNYAGWVNKYDPSVSACSGMPSGLTSIAIGGVGGSLILQVTGGAALQGLTYQWQRSFDGVAGWADIPGALSSSYLHTPTDAYFYRCKVTCSFGGVPGYSSSVFAGYAYSIIVDSIDNVPDTICVATSVFTRANGASPLLMLKTFYGDGTTDSVALTSSGATSFASVMHNYSTPGSYMIKRILYHNSIPQDTVVRFYSYVHCRALPVKFYTDLDGDCIKDSAEIFNPYPVFVRVDSNGITVKTISVTSGLYYAASGPVGTIYSFSVLPGALYASCPLGGVIYDTIVSTVNRYPVKHFAMSCSGTTPSDLSVSAVVPVTGRRDQWGHVYVRNNTCSTVDAVVELKYSYKYSDPPRFRQTPSSSGNYFLKWSLPGVTANAHIPVDRYFVGWAPLSALLTAGDTVVEDITVTSVAAIDLDTTNNHIIRIDTVRASSDPNLIEVSPAGCFDTTNQFQFTVHFENTGNDTAYNVHVLDTLSDNLDISTMEIVMSSVQVMDIYSFAAGGHNIVKFDFPGIRLLDSSWHGLNDAAFIYKIKRRSGMSDGESIFSRVGIYFDYNDVVMTNTVQNTKGCPIPAAVVVPMKPAIRGIL